MHRPRRPSAAPSYVSWADETFNPWLDPVRRLTGPLPFPASLAPPVQPSDPNQALSWQRQAHQFELEHGRRRRVLAGPWCLPMSASASPQDAVAFWQLTTRTPSIDWMVLVDFTTTDEVVTPPDWDHAYENVSVGCRLAGQSTANRTLARLRALPASRRFAIATASPDDFGDLDLSGLAWLVITGDAVVDEATLDSAASIRLQAMAFGVPVWFDYPHPAGELHMSSQGIFRVREEPKS